MMEFAGNWIEVEIIIFSAGAAGELVTHASVDGFTQMPWERP